jgi:hypothetical protein
MLPKRNSELYAPSLFERRVMMLGMLARSLEMLENGKKFKSRPRDHDASIAAGLQS